MINKENGGYGQVMNQGICKASGKYIGIVEPDDYIDLDMYRDSYSPVNSREKVYCINREYDYIRSILVKMPEVWEQFKYLYWFKKYHNYMGTLWRIGEEYREEYVQRFSEELKRGMALGELKQEVFSSAAWNNIRSMTESPEQYYLTRVYPKSMSQKVFERIDRLEIENQKLKGEIARIRKSKSFRLGRLILFLPGKLKKMLGGRKK